ncbi:MAG: SCO family protein [Planctomycetota bacterium]|nr:MAG: SCO family protein [Planctomycetota bacterium]
METRQTNSEPRRRWLWLWPAGLIALVLMTAAGVVAATIGSDERPRTNIGQLLDDVGIEPHSGAQVPLDIDLVDEDGVAVSLGELSGDKPIVLALVYYRCPMLCNMTMDGLVRSLTHLKLDAGQDFTVAVVSFDHRETPELAAAAKRTALERYDRPGAASGFRFMTGTEDQVRRLADTVGFGYRYDPSRGQFAHAAGLMVLTPGGVVSRYLYGVEFPARDLRLALVEASQGTVGSAADRVLLLCYHYDPETGKYGLAIFRVMRLAAAVTVVGLGAGVGLMLYRERRQFPDLEAPSTSNTPPGDD